MNEKQSSSTSSGQPTERHAGIWLTVWVCSLFLPATLFVSVSIIIGINLGLMPLAAAHSLSRWWASLVFSLGGIKVNVSGGRTMSDLVTEGGFIIVSNHRSALDIPLLMAFLPANVVYLAKHSLFNIPFMGRAMLKVGHLPVYRGQSAKAIGLLKAAARSIREGATVAVFPEGTRGKAGGEMLPFKMGSFVLARLAKRPLLPVAIIGTRRLLPPGSRRLIRGSVEIRIGTPISPAEFPARDMEAMAGAVRAHMESLIRGEDPQEGGKA